MPRTRTKSHSLGELAAGLGGDLIGDPRLRLEGVAALEHADPHELAVVAQQRLLPLVPRSRAGALIVGPWARDAVSPPRIVVDDPYLAFARVLAVFHPLVRPKAGVHRSAVIARSARVAKSASVGPHVVIGEGAVIGARTVVGAGCCIGPRAKIGAECWLHAGVVVYADCLLGERVIVHSGAVIGSDGFGNAREGERWVKIPQVGRVVIGDDAEIGANTTIDRGTLEDTVIGEGVKLDNQIQIAHNVKVGAHTAMAACVGVAGSTTIGRGCTVGGAGMISGHLVIGDRVNVSGGTLVAKSLAAPGTYTAVYPLQEYGEWRRNAAHLRHLDELAQRVRALEEKLARREGGSN